MTDILDKLDNIFIKYNKAIDTGNIKKQHKYYDEYILLKKEIKPSLETLTKSERKTYKIICAEFRILSNETEREKLFGNKKNYVFKSTSNNEYLNESKKISSNTTNVLKKSLEELEEAKNIGSDAMVILEIDNEKIKNATNKMDTIQSDSQIAMKMITSTMKRLYTDKLIIMFTFIIICLIIIIVLFKYNIIK